VFYYVINRQKVNLLIKLFEKLLTANLQNYSIIRYKHLQKDLNMYVSDEAEKKLKLLAEKEKRNPSQQLLFIMDFYNKNKK